MRRCLVPPARVLVRMPSWLGDYVAAEPVVRALHARCKEHGCADRITLAGPARFHALLAHLERDRVRFVDVPRGAAIPARDLRGHDVALLLDGSWRSAAAAWRAGVRERVGFASGGRTALLTQWIVPARERGAVPLGLGVHGGFPRRLPRPFGSACVELAAVCGLAVADRTPRLHADTGAIERVRARLAARGVDGPCVLVHAGARPGSSKGVPPETWAAILRELRATVSEPVVLTCAPGEEPNARAVRDLVPGCTLLDDPPLDVVELLALHARARIALTSDSGARHLAQAARVPTVVVCGPTDPRHTSEHARTVTLLRNEVPCGPCHRETCALTGDAHHACMRTIDAARVGAAVRERLARRADEDRSPG